LASLSPLKRLTSLRGKGIFPRGGMPKALHQLLSVDRVTKGRRNEDSLFPEVGKSQEFVVLYSLLRVETMIRSFPSFELWPWAAYPKGEHSRRGEFLL
jgi:hypothetical protein